MLPQTGLRVESFMTRWTKHQAKRKIAECKCKLAEICFVLGQFIWLSVSFYYLTPILSHMHTACDKPFVYRADYFPCSMSVCACAGDDLTDFCVKMSQCLVLLCCHRWGTTWQGERRERVSGWLLLGLTWQTHFYDGSHFLQGIMSTSSPGTLVFLSPFTHFITRFVRCCCLALLVWFPFP